MDQETAKPDKLCAYCGRSGSLTREHVLPAFIYEYEGKRSAAAQLGNFKAGDEDVIAEAEFQIRDVCAKCNSGVLSSLDGYGKTLYEKYFGHFAMPGMKIVFEFDYQQLMRWLLKITFNCARARKWPAETILDLARNREFITAGNNAPNDCELFVQLLAPLKPSMLSHKMNPRGQPWELNPKMSRIVLVSNSWFRSCFLVSLNSFQFYLAFHDEPEDKRRVVRDRAAFSRSMPGLYSLESSKGSVALYTSSWTMADMLKISPALQRTVIKSKDWKKRRG